MTIRATILLCVAALGFAASCDARRAPTSLVALWDPDQTAPTVHDVASAAARAHTTHCRTSPCKAIIVIHELAGIWLYEVGDANGVASLNVGNRPEIAGELLDRILLNHPELYVPFCATGTKLISHVRIDSGPGEILIPVLLLVNGVDIDLRDHGHCARDLVAALPRAPANDEIRINARESCENSDENHHRPRIACTILADGVDEKR